MFFKKNDEISDQQIVAIAITAATVCYIVERNYPSKNVASHVKYVNDSVDNILKSIGINPNKETLTYIQMTTSTLANNTDNFIGRRTNKFKAGDKGVQESEITEALKILQKSVNEFNKFI